MPLPEALTASLVGVVEGTTEFLPISSTGHLIFLVDLPGFKGPPGRVFEVVIQFGAILGVCWVHKDRLVQLIINPVAPGNMRLWTLLGIAFLPSALIGFLAHGFIKSVLFSPLVVSGALIAGGIAIIVIERLTLQSRVAKIDDITPAQALTIGLCQALAMIPGTSRLGATIICGLIFGLDRKTAAEFSFLLAIGGPPTKRTLSCRQAILGGGANCSPGFHPRHGRHGSRLVSAAARHGGPAGRRR